MMIALLQRVSAASVDVNSKRVATIGFGLLVFVGVEQNDDESIAVRLAQRVLTYRIFADANGRMNRSVQEIAGALLVVPQFTLAADTRKGTRASFTLAAEPVLGAHLFDYFVSRLHVSGIVVHTGVFGVDMRVTLTNEGPVTFWLSA